MPGGPEQLVDGRFLAQGAILGPGEHAQRVVAHDPQAAPGFGQALAQDRVASSAVGLGDGDDFVQFILELHLLAKGGNPALETEQGHGDLPAFAGLADDVRSVGAGVVEEHLVEFRGAGQLFDRAHADTGLSHGYQQERQPVVANTARLGAGDDETPVRFVGQRSPDLLPVDDPTVAAFIQCRAGLDVGQVRACAGLRIALAPEVVTTDDARQKALFLLFAAEGGNGRPGQAFADMAHAPRATGAGIFFMEDHLLGDRQAAPAMLRRPADAGPATAGQLAFPGLARFGEHMFVARAAAKTQWLELAAQIGGQPVGHLLAEALVLLAETDLHDCSPRITLAMRSRCQAGVPRKLSQARARLK
ncbi:hypothetical protein D3C80_747250 [compost metagenome]